MIEPKSGMRFVIPYTLVRPVEHGEILPDGVTKVANLSGDKWWAKPDGLDQKDIMVFFRGVEVLFEKYHKAALKLGKINA